MDRRSSLLLFGGIALLVLLYAIATYQRRPVANQGETRPISSGHYKNKWIVLTSIFKPTPTVVKLASLPDGNCVVVGDKKSPPDWNLKGCTFLSPTAQLELKYEILEFVGWNSYARKNIGYLYAIQHGATLIYETDDDNILAQDGIVVFPENLQVLTYKNNMEEPVVNPYAYFGYPTVWPRGYPLEHIAASKKTGVELEIRLMNMTIQQGLADLDPDVDAVFRLTRSEDLKKIRFHERPPVVVPQGKMCPFNSQNTLFHYNALWGMLIPVTTTFRVCDIWRGYWVQRMLWDVGGNLGFTAASAIQDRNPHNYIRDMEDELDLYMKGGKLVEFLLKWRSKTTSFFDRLVELAVEMEKEQFWKAGDVKLMQAWIRDLKKVGYKEPAVVQ